MGSEVFNASDVRFRGWSASNAPYTEMLNKPGQFSPPARFRSKDDAEVYAAKNLTSKNWKTAYLLEVEFSMADIWMQGAATYLTLVGTEPLSERARHSAARREKETQMQSLRTQLAHLEAEIAKLT